MQAERQAHLFASQEAACAEREAERLARKGPDLAVARVMVARLGDAVPDVLALLGKANGGAKLTALLREEFDRQAQIAAAERAASLAVVNAAVTERARARQAAEQVAKAKRRVAGEAA